MVPVTVINITAEKRKEWHLKWVLWKGKAHGDLFFSITTIRFLITGWGFAVQVNDNNEALKVVVLEAKSNGNRCRRSTNQRFFSSSYPNSAKSCLQMLNLYRTVLCAASVSCPVLAVTSGVLMGCLWRYSSSAINRHGHKSVYGVVDLVGNKEAPVNLKA